MFDVNLEEVEVTLSFMRWLDGKGLVKDAKVKGVRGVVGECRVEQSRPELARGLEARSGFPLTCVDRRSVWWDPSKPLSPADFRHATRPGDFELEVFADEDHGQTLLVASRLGGC